VIFLAVGGIIALCSFLPRINIPWLGAQEAPQPHHNLVFYSDIAKYNPQEYLTSFYSAHNLGTGTPTKAEQDYAEQIVANSRIALNKYKYFRAALWITISGILTPVLAVVLYKFFTERE